MKKTEKSTTAMYSFGEYLPRPPQDEILKVLEKTRFVVLVAHRRMGKTVLAVNHLVRMASQCAYRDGSYAYIAPFRNQAKSIAWRYFLNHTSSIEERQVSESELSITLPNGAKIRLFGADNPDALRGLYFDGIILDEVAQMRPCIWQEILRPTLADRNGWAVFIGTPRGINLFSEMYELAKREQNGGNNDWAALMYKITDTNVLPPDEVKKIRSELSDNAFRQEFMCDFQASSDDALIAPELVYEASQRNMPFTRGYDSVVLGVDVARFGSDSTVFMLRSGLACREPVVLRGADNMLVADRLACFIRSENPSRVCIDSGGGAGVIDRLRRLGFDVLEIPFGSRALDEHRFVNRRMEMWWNMREWLRSGGAIPNNASLRNDLCTPLYSFDDCGRLKLESKDSIRERLGRSPDIADALALTFSVPLPSASSGLLHPNKARTEYNALEWR